MKELYPFEKSIKFNASNRTIQIDTKSASEAQEVKENLEDADNSAKHWPHKRPASVNYTKRSASVKYNVNISGSAIDISGNDLIDIIAALDDIHNKNYITKDKRNELAQQIGAVEDTPELRAQRQAHIMENIKARRKQRQKETSIGSSSQLLMPPKKSLPSASSSINGYHQNGNTHLTSTKPPIK